MRDVPASPAPVLQSLALVLCIAAAMIPFHAALSAESVMQRVPATAAARISARSGTGTAKHVHARPAVHEMNERHFVVIADGGKDKRPGVPRQDVH